MKQHKRHIEIKAWADGAEIESRYIGDSNRFSEYKDWSEELEPNWDGDEDWEYRVKPQPVEVVASGQPFRFKEKKYLYVYADGDFFIHSQSPIGAPASWQYFGKIEVQND